MDTSNNLAKAAAAAAGPAFSPTSNMVLADAPAAFAAIPKKGKVQHKFGYADFGTGAHIQGMGAYKEYMLFTHNREKSSGFWAVGHPDNSVKLFDIAAPKDFHHSGGFQVIGDFAAVGIERSESDNKQAYIYLYDLTQAGSSGPKLLSSPQIFRSNGGAACVGLVYVQGHYVLAAFTTFDHKVHFYQSNNALLGQSQLSFGDELFAIEVVVDGKTANYDNLNLVADAQNNLYLIGLRGKKDGLSFADYAELVQIDMPGRTYKLISSRHLVTDTQGLGIVGSHLRYGAGTQVVSPDLLHLFCSSRIFTAMVNTQLNYFY